MNDFTKQELIDLHDLCYGEMHGDHPVEDWKLSLQTKIKSMIDNYCEHEWINVHEQLPNDGQHVIAYCQNYPENFVSMARFEKNKHGYYFWNDAIDKKGNVTHWMPLPDPPV